MSRPGVNCVTVDAENGLEVILSIEMTGPRGNNRVNDAIDDSDRSEEGVEYSIIEYSSTRRPPPGGVQVSAANIRLALGHRWLGYGRIFTLVLRQKNIGRLTK